MIRVVLYAEGAGELVGGVTQLPPVGEPMTEEMLGPAHMLSRRAIGECWGMDPRRVRFDAPLRTRGRLPRGSDLHHGRSLCKLLTWPRPQQQPDLALVLVDADGDRQRANKLKQSIANDIQVPLAIAVAIQEFEAWLVADHEHVRSTLDIGSALPGATDAPESLGPGHAKQLLADWIGRAGVEEDTQSIRCRLAAACSLERLRTRCRAFQRWTSELRRLKP